MSTYNLDWIKVGQSSDLPDGRVKNVTARTTSICLVHYDGLFDVSANGTV